MTGSPDSAVPGETATANRGNPGNVTSLEQLAAEQGIAPLADPTELRGNFWPGEENLDEFLTALRAWRNEGREEIEPL